MKSETVFKIIIGIAVAGAIIYAFTQLPPMPQTEQEAPVSNVDATKGESVSNLVTEFGSRLQLVSLLASRAAVETAMDEHYAPYVSSELLASWKADPANAPGRKVSNPYPARIEVLSMIKLQESPTLYRVDARVLEVTSADLSAGTFTASAPVIIEVTEDNDALYISAYEEGLYERPIASPVSNLPGTAICLPHKETDGPITLECAFGLKGDDGFNYALDMDATSPDSPLTFDNGKRYAVTGTLIFIEAISSNQWQKYDIRGIIRVDNFSEIL